MRDVSLLVHRQGDSRSDLEDRAIVGKERNAELRRESDVRRVVGGQSASDPLSDRDELGIKHFEPRSLESIRELLQRPRTPAELAPRDIQQLQEEKTRYGH